MKRKATAIWKGNGPDGTGTLTTQSGAFTNQPYSAKLRFQNEDGKAGTNPEELIGAAHAGCYAMALSFQLTEEGVTPDELRVDAAVTLEKQNGGFAITAVHLTLNAKVPGLDQDTFEKLANGAKENCPVSKVLNADITLDATLA